MIRNFNFKKVLWLFHIFNHEVLYEIVLSSVKAPVSLPIKRIKLTYTTRRTMSEIVCLTST